MTVIKVFTITFIMSFMLVALNELALAKRGCCSLHGGVRNCDQETGRIVCNDWTYSPSCVCEPDSTNPKFRGSPETEESNSYNAQ